MGLGLVGTNSSDYWSASF